MTVTKKESDFIGNINSRAELYGLHGGFMNYYSDYTNQRTRKDELMNKETPLIDYATHRRTDEVGERQDGAGAIGWLAVAAVCWIIALVMMAKAGYFL